MPRPKNSSKKAQNFGSRKSKGKEDFLGKKKSEVEEVIDKVKEKAEEVVEDIKEKIEDIKEDAEEKIEELGEKTSKKKKSEKKGTKKIKEIKEKAKELAEKIEEPATIKEKLEEELTRKKKMKKTKKTIFPLDDYVKYGTHLGTKAITPHMRQFVYRRRADGLAVLNTNSIDEKLKEAAEFLAKFEPGDIFIACKREVGWLAAKKFSEVIGIKAFTKKYPAGIITNPQLDDFFETELVIICDPWLDKNALNDAVRVKRPVIGLCDTNNLTTGITKVIPCNNKASKSLGLILYLLAKEYLKARGKKIKLSIEDFTGVEEEKGAKEGV